MEHTVSTILKVIVGSQAHGLATPASDFDYHGVFVVPTEEILSLGSSPKQTSWIEGSDDDTSWELGHFLGMAVHCNPTVLETFVAPVKESTREGEELRTLFPYLWNPIRVRDAFIGYGVNQRKKFLEDKDARGPKYAVAYLRVLHQATTLLTTGVLPVSTVNTPVYDTLKRWKSWTKADINYGEVIGLCKEWEGRVNDAYEAHQTNLSLDDRKANDFLLDVRERHWRKGSIG